MMLIYALVNLVENLLCKCIDLSTNLLKHIFKYIINIIRFRFAPVNHQTWWLPLIVTDNSIKLTILLLLFPYTRLWVEGSGRQCLRCIIRLDVQWNLQVGRKDEGGSPAVWRRRECLMERDFLINNTPLSPGYQMGPAFFWSQRIQPIQSSELRRIWSSFFSSLINVANTTICRFWMCKMRE